MQPCSLLALILRSETYKLATGVQFLLFQHRSSLSKSPRECTRQLHQHPNHLVGKGLKRSTNKGEAATVCEFMREGGERT